MVAPPSADESHMHSMATHSVLENEMVHSSDADEGAGPLTAALAELEETTARVVLLRQRVERLMESLADRRSTLDGLERELAAARVSAGHDREAILQLEREVTDRDETLAHLRTELTGLAIELGMPQSPQ
jgi:chromosome segregation ATPase